jgi:hypothetical protein
MNITKRAGQNAHFAAGAPITVNLNGSRCLVSDYCSRRADLKTPGILTMHASLWKTNLDIIVVLNPDI